MPEIATGFSVKFWPSRALAGSHLRKKDTWLFIGRRGPLTVRQLGISTPSIAMIVDVSGTQHVRSLSTGILRCA